MGNFLAAGSAVNDSQVSTASTTTVIAPLPKPAAQAAAVAVAEATAQRTQAPQEPSFAAVKQAAKQLETFMQSMNRYLEFRIDQDSGRTVVTVKDKTTGDTVRQIPSEEVLRLAQNLGGKAHTGLVDQTA
jgi:flagellar protein FlaG